jgi:hypothetical protein
LYFNGDLLNLNSNHRVQKDEKTKCVTFLCISSCSDDDENETCMNCSAFVSTEVNGEVLSEANLLEQEVCGSILENTLSNPTQVVTMQVESNIHVTTTVYTCQ